MHVPLRTRFLVQGRCSGNAGSQVPGLEVMGITTYGQNHTRYVAKPGSLACPHPVYAADADLGLQRGVSLPQGA